MNIDADRGYIESAQTLVDVAARQWSQGQLRQAAEAAELRNTGWPIGIVLPDPVSGPKPTEAGIEARVQHYDHPMLDDYWLFSKDGSYYVARLFEENVEKPGYQTSLGHPERPLWFDIRIWRIAEVLLHSASIYRALDISPDEPYMLAVNHTGLEGREFASSSMGRIIRRGRICRVPQASWKKEVTQDVIRATLKDLVYEIGSELFVLFDFADVSRGVADEIVDDFLRSRL